jgi:STE24 endopeptidase
MCQSCGVSAVRLPVAPAVLAAVGAAEAAVLLLRPRDGVVPTTPVQARGYFSAAEIERSRAYRRPQRRLGLAAGALRAGLLGAAVRRPPAVLARDVRRPVAAAAAAGAALTVADTVAGLPFALLARRRALRVGLATDPWSSWAADHAKATGIGAVLAGGASAAVVAAMRRSPQWWWLPAAGGTVGFAALGAAVAPVLLDPVFNRFEALEGEPRDAVLGLAERAGVRVGSVLKVDASRRTSAANAYVTGLGATKRVVLFDTLLDRYPAAERDLVIAHELAHVRHRDVQRQLALLALTAPATAWAVAALTARLAPPGPAGAHTLPALAVAAGLAGSASALAAARLSRRVEARADSFALSLVPDPDAFIGFERRIALQNLADPDPPGIVQRTLATHPSTVQRIGIAETVRRGGAAAGAVS